MRRAGFWAALVATALIAFGAGFAFGAGPRLASLLLGGGSAKDPAWERLESVQAFDTLMQSVGDIRDMVLAEAESEREVVQGMRWILRNVAETSEIIADANVRRPFFQRMDTDARKVGGDNPDGEYHLATIDGRFPVRISGNRGSVRYFSLTVNAGRGMSDRRMAAFLNDETIFFDDAGDFTLLLSPERPSLPGQWVEIPEDATSVMTRQYIADRSREELVTLHIEPLEPAPPLTATTDGEVGEALRAMNYGFVFLTTLHKIVLPQAWEEPNRFFTTDSDSLGGAISSPDNLYMIGSFAVGPGEAVVVDVDPPDTRYWNLALETHWHETIEYLHRPASRTLEEATHSEDGRVRFVIALEDPGVPNWLDPMGNGRGFMTFRWLDARGLPAPIPEVRRIALSELSALLDGVGAGVAHAEARQPHAAR